MAAKAKKKAAAKKPISRRGGDGNPSTKGGDGNPSTKGGNGNPMTKGG